MFSIEMESKLGMIHFGRFPTIGCVTCSAFGSKLTVVMVILFMTGETRLGSGLQISKFARVDMALGTSQRRVFANKIEWHFIMIKDRAMRINAIVTGHTVRAEGQEMFGGEGHVHLQMAIAA